VEAFIKARMGKVIDMDGCVGAINTFIVEPFVPHDQEYYLCIQARAPRPSACRAGFLRSGGTRVRAWCAACSSTAPVPAKRKAAPRASLPEPS